jgi:hypothetical protein
MRLETYFPADFLERFFSSSFFDGVDEAAFPPAGKLFLAAFPYQQEEKMRLTSANERWVIGVQG